MKAWTWEIHPEEVVVASGRSISLSAARATVMRRAREVQGDLFVWIYEGDDFEKVESWLTGYRTSGRYRWLTERHAEGIAGD